MPDLFFDLHCHPGTKTLFRYDNQISVWQNVEVPGSAFDSQSSYKLIARSKINLVCIAIHPPEKGMVDQWLIRVASHIPLYRQYLQRSRLHDMTNDEFDYKELIEDEFENIHEEDATGKKTLKFLTSFSEYDKDNIDILHIFFSIEGGHSYYTDRNKCTNVDEMLCNFRKILTKGLVFFSGITHLTPNAFANHAYGCKIASKGNFLPVGNGITDAGFRLIEEIYKHNVLVDIKHMSWVSREKFYQFRRDNYPDKPIIASHIAFTGFSVGERKDQITKHHPKWGKRHIIKIKYDKKEGIINNTFFNPNSINFYDDDIIEILKSKGLLGIILDIRVLGGEKGSTEKEFVSKAEFEQWQVPESFIAESLKLAALENEFYNDEFEKDYMDAGHKINGYDEVNKNDLGELLYDIWDEDDLKDEEDEFNELFPRNAYRNSQVPDPDEHLKYFINHLLKFQMIANKHTTEFQSIGINPWHHICIGSDFDGMIKSIDCCKTAADFGGFSKTVLQALPKYAMDYKVKLSMSEQEIVERIFFKNAYDFMVTHFSSRSGK